MKRSRPAIYKYATYDFEGEQATCWLATFTDTECSGPLEHAHLVEKQRLRKEGHADLIPDPRTWVPACRTHHVALDHYRGLTVPREAIPSELEDLCAEIGLTWALDKRFGERSVAA